MKIELLSGAKGAHDYLPIRVHELALKYGIEQRHVCEKLVEFHADKLIRLSAWDDNEARDKPFDEWPNAESFFACRWDGNYKRVQLLVRGSEFLEKLVASELQSSGQQQVDGADPDRKFARRAIDEARKSVPESDGRPHPKVGAVVVKDGKVLSTAHRGEVPGNHAEFIALEKNLPDAAVAGATVYTTLEPCTTRNPPKIPCVDRLIERRVARVVIGILDPDDRIRGKGQRKLSNAGIVTALFPHDLAMEVEELNREFTRFCERQCQTIPIQSSRTQPTSTPVLKAYFIRSHLMPRSPWQSLVEGVFKAVGRSEYEVECDFLYEVFLVNTTENQVTVRNFIAEVQIGEKWKKLKRLDDLTDYKIQTGEDYKSPKKDLVSLTKLIENVPLVRGIGYRGWLRFQFITDKTNLEPRVHSRVRIIDALDGEHEVDTSEPRDTSQGELIHNPANVFKN